MKKKSRKRRYPIRKSGKRCGYDEYEDGSIKIAPMYSDQIDTIMLEKAAVDELIKSVIAQGHKLLVPITKTLENFWESVREDYRLNNEKYNYTYDRTLKRISRKKKETKETK